MFSFIYQSNYIQWMENILILYPYIFAIIISIIVVRLIWTNHPNSKYIMIFILIFSLVTTTHYNIQHNPILILWLCNFTAMIGLYLCYRFHQIVFDIFFYFCWTGDLFTLLVFDNPVAPPMSTNPIAFMGFIFKHSIPLILTIYLIKNGYKKVSSTALRHSLLAIIAYTVFVGFINLLFDSNIMDLRYATLDIEKAFGPWPYYVIVNISIALIWFKSIEFITKKIRLIHT